MNMLLTPSPYTVGSCQLSLLDSHAGDISSQHGDFCSYVERSSRIDARLISDATIGLSDGLTVPFALTAGLSALGSIKIVIYGGLAELIAGAISMGIGGYLGAETEAASYQHHKEQTKRTIAEDSNYTSTEIIRVFGAFNFPQHTVDDICRHIASTPNAADFVMHFVNRTTEPTTSRAFVSAMTIASGYFFGGLLPLLPYFFVDQNSVYTGLYLSIGITVLALFMFGYVKSCLVVGWNGSRCIQQGCFGGMQMVVVGGTAAAAAMGLVRLFNQEEQHL